MTPIEQLAALYDSQETERSLESDIELFLYNGYVISTPRYIVMGKEIVRGLADDLVRDPAYTCRHESCNAWYVYAYAGSHLDFLSFMPYELPFVAWHRRHARVARYYPINKVRTLCARLTPFLTRS